MMGRFVSGGTMSRQESAVERAQRLTAELAQELARISEQTSAMRQLLERDAHRAPLDYPAEARTLFDDRRRRADHFDPSIFGEPAWDMMLDLLGTYKAGRSVPVSNCCAAAAVPSDTAIRWIRHLERRGLVKLLPDPFDERQLYAQLTENGLARMKTYLDTVPPRSEARA
ncbi:helix-turn-helix domain-containing protein [Sphingomonas nostoxanthinifaciens]|uniref:MarR family transcriptional regulator n=1 Tax=Sphingomonas nostoxanthinifaciens TaxID=2872652 RepID=UPI001CC1FF00|nr:MarR family transcriptional regulator [Sphingomonas nostoxanthinifaciens]UAK25235.1 MarR family transcriptional regulator [Sphingomonas nostoxanthinifaciens]